LTGLRQSIRGAQIGTNFMFAHEFTQARLSTAAREHSQMRLRLLAAEIVLERVRVLLARKTARFDVAQHGRQLESLAGLSLAVASAARAP
jgi:hypothetical protein